jgi:hypothetical protein
MSLTIGAGASELRKSEPATVTAAADIAAAALLRGARGNSGVILSLLFRGMAKSLKGMETAGTHGAAGVSVWVMGVEDPSLWTALADEAEKRKFLQKNVSCDANRRRELPALLR